MLESTSNNNSAMEVASYKLGKVGFHNEYGSVCWGYPEGLVKTTQRPSSIFRIKDDTNHVIQVCKPARKIEINWCQPIVSEEQNVLLLIRGYFEHRLRIKPNGPNLLQFVTELDLSDEICSPFELDIEIRTEKPFEYTEGNSLTVKVVELW